VSLGSQRAVLMRGDPGLFDIVKKGLGFVARQTPVGRTIGTAVSFGRRFSGGGGRVALPSPRSVPRPGGFRPPSLSFGPQAQMLQADGAMTGGCPKGHHPNRSSYHTSEGFVAQGTRCVRNRRRNLSNGRANTRALRRMAAWEKQDKKRRKTLQAIARSAN